MANLTTDKIFHFNSLQQNKYDVRNRPDQLDRTQKEIGYQIMVTTVKCVRFLKTYKTRQFFSQKIQRKQTLRKNMVPEN